MSKLIEKLQKANRATPQPMGFGASRVTRAASRLVLIAGIDPASVDDIAGYTRGADALLLVSGKALPPLKNIQKELEPVPDMPWGIYLEENGEKMPGALAEAGCDFTVFPAASRITTAPQDEKVGKILEIESSMDDSLLRAVNFLAVDAALLTETFEGNGSLVWHQLMIFQHLANLLAKPLLIPVPGSVSEAELKALWEAGVDGVVVAAGSAGKGGFDNLRQIIDSLPPRSRPKSGKVEAVLPRAVAGEARTPVPDEEEEEEDE